jgi:hypothetical protein
MRSPYTLEDPPPIEPPVAVVEATAWSIAAGLWHSHRPDSLLGTDCVQCRHGWPCPTWEVADGIIGDVCAEAPAGNPRGTAAAPAPAPAEPAASGRHATGHPVPETVPRTPAEPTTRRRRRRAAADPAEAQTDVLPCIGAPPRPADAGTLPRR